MSNFRQNVNFDSMRNGTPKGDEIYFRLRRSQAGRLCGHSEDVVSPHPDNPKIFLTPYTQKYFEGVLPTQIPENSKAEQIVFVTDVDSKFWEFSHGGPPSNTFNELTDELYASGQIQAWGSLLRFFEKAFVQNMRHMPKALFFNEETSTALVVLSACQSAHFHLQEFAGIGCIADRGFDSSEVHDALMRHEWFHLSTDYHLSETQKEVEADKCAIQGIETPSLKQTWIDARVVGGFMWPFPGRQNGLAFVDPKFEKKAFQEMQMQAVYEWCEAVFNEFFDSEVAAKLVSNIYEGQERDECSLPKEMQNYIENRFYNKLYNTRKQITSPQEFKKWFMDGEDNQLAEQTWKYLTQANMMRLQISNADKPEFYREMHQLSEKISSTAQGVKESIHQHFREALERLLPDVQKGIELFEPDWKNTELPNIHIRRGPYIG